MNAEAKKQRSPEEVWKAIEEEAGRDEMERITNLSDADLDEELRAEGFDPDEMGRQAAAFAQMLLDRREVESEPEAAIVGSRARLAARRARRVKRPRAELQSRIAAAQKDPRLPKSAVVQFRNHNAEEAADEHLADLLDFLEDLIEQHEAKAKLEAEAKHEAKAKIVAKAKQVTKAKSGAKAKQGTKANAKAGTKREKRNKR